MDLPAGAPATERRLLRQLVVAYALLVGGVLAVAPRIDAMAARLGEVRSEYTTCEQLSKYVVLLLILASVRGYAAGRRPVDVATAILTLLLGLALYLGESNMIVDWCQPAFGAALGIPVILLLRRAGSRTALLLFLAGMLGLAAGGILDSIADRRLATDLPVLGILAAARAGEELFEAAGIALVALAVFLRFRSAVLASVASDRIAATWIAGCGGLIAAGNSFVHFQYSPGTRLRVVALGLSAAGFAGLWWANRRLDRAGAALRLGTPGMFYALAFAVFVLLPAVFGRSDGIVSLAFWPPVFLAMAVLLFRHHPAAGPGLRPAGPR